MGKNVLKLAGIDISVFKPHSIRSASTSVAHKCNVSIDVILKAAGWSNESTFRKFYNRPVTIKSYDEHYSVKILKKYAADSYQ